MHPKKPFNRIIGMNPDDQILFNYLEPVTLPTGLNDRIITTVRHHLRQRQVFWRRMNTTILTVGFVSLWPALYYLSQGLTHAGLSAYGSLMWYDQNLLLNYWPELGWSLLESLPLLNIATVLTVVVALGFSLAHLTHSREPSFNYQTN